MCGEKTLTQLVSKELLERQEQKRRLEWLLARHVMSVDDQLSDADFVTVVVRRWAEHNHLILSIGVSVR